MKRRVGKEIGEKDGKKFGKKDGKRDYREGREQGLKRRAGKGIGEKKGAMTIPKKFVMIVSNGHDIVFILTLPEEVVRFPDESFTYTVL